MASRSSTTTGRPSASASIASCFPLARATLPAVGGARGGEPALASTGGARSGTASALAWAVLLLGVAVGLFHAAAFRYFWMTLGLFPAIAFAIAREPILGLAQAATPRARRLAVVGFCLLLAVPGVMTMGFLLSDAQAVQRDSLGFVHRNFRPRGGRLPSRERPLLPGRPAADLRRTSPSTSTSASPEPPASGTPSG